MPNHTQPVKTNRLLEKKLKRLLEGVLAPSDLVLPWEPQEEFERLRVKFIFQLKPVGKLEMLLVEQIVGNVWRLRRTYRIESGMLGGADLKNALDWAPDDGRSLHIPYDLTDFLEPSGPSPDSALPPENPECGRVCNR